MSRHIFAFCKLFYSIFSFRELFLLTYPTIHRIINMKVGIFMSEHFFENLKRIRIEKGYSQKEFAEKLGVAKSTYCMYESGNREPNVQTIKKISKLLNVPTDELLGLDIEPTTLAAHFDGDEYTEEELEEIKRFAKFVKSQRGFKATDMFKDVGKMSSELIDKK